MSADDYPHRAAAPAKINLWLRVLAREESGYHQIETLFCTLELADTVALRIGGEHVSLDVEGADVGPIEENLVYRAATAFRETARIPDGFALRLEKRIPVGAGLGGGSSDAATTLRLLNAAFGWPLKSDELLRLGASLGSDVPFFLAGQPLALAWGRGERFLRLPALPPMPVLVAAPPFAIATPDAYAALAAARQTAQPASLPASLEIERATSWDAVAELAANDFEDALFPTHDALPTLKAALRRLGAHPALLSGSGSALFGVFRSEAERDSAAAELRRNAPDVRLFHTATASVSDGSGG